MISVIIPTLRRPKILLERTVKSIQNQTVQDWECIIVDGTPTDETKDAVALAGDARLHYFKKLEGRQATARNYGVQHARGEFIAMIDDDDEFAPTFFEEALAVFKAHPEISYLSSHAINRDDNGVDTYSPYNIDPYWRYGIGNMFMFRREVFFDRQLFFDENLIFGEDLDLHVRFHNDGQKGYIIPKSLRVYYLGLAPAKRAGGKTSGATTQSTTFDAFFKKNEANYRAAGNEAAAWLYLYGGLVFARVGEMKRARWFLSRSFRFKPNATALAAFFAACFGYGFFLWYDRAKLRLMRFVRAHILNPVRR